MGFVLICVSDMTVSVIGGSVGRSRSVVGVIESDNVPFMALNISAIFSSALTEERCSFHKVYATFSLRSLFRPATFQKTECNCHTLHYASQ